MDPGSGKDVNIMKTMKISKAIKDTIKKELKMILPCEKIVDLDYWDCMGDVMVTCITIHHHVVRRYTFSYTIDCEYCGKRLNQIGEVNIM